VVNALTDGERLVRCLTFQDVDRPPFMILFGPWEQAIKRWVSESGLSRERVINYFKTDRGFTHVPVAEGIFPPYETRVLEETEEHVILRDGRGITMRQRKDGGSIPEWLDYPVKGWDDWEKLKHERLDPDHPGRYRVDWDEFNSQLQQGGTVAQVGTFPYGVFGTPRDLMGAEELLCSFVTRPDLIKDIMNYLTDFWIRIWDRVSEHVRISHIHIWEDMAGRQGSLISPAMVEEFMMPNYRKIKQFADSKDISLVSVDTDGDCSELVPVMVENGVNVMFPFEVQAGCDVEVFRKRFPRLGIMGGLDKRALAKGREAINQEIDKVKRMIQFNGYVASPDHLIPPDVSWDHYKYFMERLRYIIYGHQGGMPSGCGDAWSGRIR